MPVLLSLFAAGLLLVALPAQAEDHKTHETQAEWGYAGQISAPFWGELDQAYHACTHGQKQSPVNIGQYKVDETLPLPEFHYDFMDLEVHSSKTALHVNAGEGHKVMFGDAAYHLKGIHFHTPSEHYVDGVPYPLEAHLVHSNDEGQLAVIGVMFKLGQANDTLETIWSHIPGYGETAAPEGVTINALDLLPADTRYYTYEGSLTTPPCTEGVKWIVMQQPISLSMEQLKAFQALIPVNARPLQPLHGRMVTGQ